MLLEKPVDTIFGYSTEVHGFEFQKKVILPLMHLTTSHVAWLST